MVSPFRQQVDDGILDHAAALLARRGAEKTSVQDVADAVGLSKAGLLHHFPSKDALLTAVRGQADSLGERVLEQVRHLPVGAERDARAVEAFVDVALAHPGLVALLLVPATRRGAGADAAHDTSAAQADAALLAFGVDPSDADPERLVRVLGALGALAVLTLAAHQADETTGWRRHVVATSYDALGHRRPSASLASTRTDPEA